MKSGSEQELIAYIIFLKTSPISQLGDQNRENLNLNDALTNNLNSCGLVFIKIECKFQKNKKKIACLKAYIASFSKYLSFLT